MIAARVVTVCVAAAGALHSSSAAGSTAGSGPGASLAANPAGFSPSTPSALPPSAQHEATTFDGASALLLNAGSLSIEPEPPAAEHEPSDASELAKKLQNPVADLISIPFQFNYDEGYGPKDAGRMTLNIQPVIPITLTQEWNLITRTIVPVIRQESMAEGLSADYGMGDITQSFFFSPKDPVGGWILGAGPVALWPTGTDPQLRSEQLGLGPTIVALRQQSGWTYGVLANHIWGVTDSDDHPEVNSTFLQPFLSYTWPSATTITFNTESTYNWNSTDWTVPLNIMGSQIVRIGRLPVSLQVGFRYYADSPYDGPEWGLRFNLTVLLPR